jgi:hypothetical protein
VTERHCNSCLPYYYALSQSGCKGMLRAYT